jgi:epoxyqueuosine reductase QueG
MMKTDGTGAQTKQVLAGLWLYTHGEQTHGPVSITELRAAAYLGFVGPKDMVCNIASGSWVYATCVPGLFEELKQ